MKRFLVLFLSFSMLAVVAACGPKPPRPPAPEPLSVPAVTETGYAVQLGAFANPANAVRLTERLRKRGEDVYTFRHGSGLYKVRLGDFPTRAEALAKARRLVSEGLAKTYYIVGPEDYALARAGVQGGDLLRSEIVRTAKGFIGLPYQWGGDSPEEGFDCSGLIMASYQMNGLNIPRSSREQFQRGREVSLGELQRADLVFFSIQSGRKVSHVGLYAGDGLFIHAPGRGKRIRADSLSNPFFQRRFAGARAYL